MTKKDGEWQRYLRAMREMGRFDPGTFKPGHSEFGAVGDRGYELPPRPDGTRYRPTAASQSLRGPK
ncbi:hypothetical protein [Mycolicibacterium tusciae]|uniref:hypothetical protein n=1 Tax=Mycolicibacterium tusciae TaxID=75922 RepID=UPI00024A233F|nr:hypothetical protein [Mycolicibacterium tusciae]